MPDRLKGLFRWLRICSDRPLTWLSRIMSTLLLFLDDDTNIFVVFCFIFCCGDGVCFKFMLESLLDICPFIKVGMGQPPAFFVYECCWVALWVLRLSFALEFTLGLSSRSTVVEQARSVFFTSRFQPQSAAGGIFSHADLFSSSLLVVLLFDTRAVKRFAVSTTSLVFSSSVLFHFMLPSDDWERCEKQGLRPMWIYCSLVWLVML